MSTPEAKRIRAAINRLALTQPRTRKVEVRFVRAGDPSLCCFCTHAIPHGDTYRNAGTIMAHETCFKAVAEEYKSR